ncbi:MAG: hypothetical protein H6772_01755 [Pseudomonadales bacterium]|nr:hypothetical protein [Pseudomonadales bacterium]
MKKKKSSTIPNSLTSVTPFSKLLAAVLFITLPLIAFIVGMKYGIRISQLAYLF